MKRTLTLKLLMGYLLFIITGFFLLSTFVQYLTNNYLKKEEAQRLYRESTIIAADLKTYFNSSEHSFADIQNQLEIIGGYLSVEIWITDIDGNILLNSSDPSISQKKQSVFIFPSTIANITIHSYETIHENENTHIIQNFDISDFGNAYYKIGNFYEYFSEETLTVFAPITNDYKVKGYVFVHKPVSEILLQSDGIMNLMFSTVCILFVSAIILIIVFFFFICRPIQKLANIAQQYAKGNFSEKIHIQSNDEIGYLANTLNYMATELDTLEEEQRKFISNISHDFRSPLTSIKGYIEAMLDGTIPIEMQEKYLNIILFETKRLNKLTQNILDLNRFGHHGVILDITKFDINQMIRTITMTFEGVCREKGLSFDLLLTEKQLFVKGDMGKIQQVLYNLIDNATKFSYNNTTIIIETTLKNGKVFISVKDFGLGIPSDSLKKIWERFYKTDLSRGKDKKGTGLGLAIVKEIIQAHNENINVISTEGVGTEFIFTLPWGNL
ncbi:MAG: HAMP domain-containing histidine kinase [Lachnospiraceae bacterium]|nr:HAMP domain-containing histidine kinase [Lachnospiraceae bacterium]